MRWQMIWEPLFAAVDQALKTKERPLWVTGHSLGGALALLAAWRFQRNFLAVHEIITFGAPMIGNDTAAKAFEQEFSGKIFRYVDLEDLVPHLPSVSLLANAYTHCLNEVSLSAAQAAGCGCVGLEALKQTAGSTAEGVIDPAMVDQVWGLVKTRIASHMIANYQVAGGGQVQGSDLSLMAGRGRRLKERSRFKLPVNERDRVVN